MPLRIISRVNSFSDLFSTRLGPGNEFTLGNQHAFDNLRESELIPGHKASAEEIRELARLASASFGHAVGTCKIGVDKLAVVDPELRVHGISGLRVADASVIPQIITGPGTSASTHRIAGRGARITLASHAARTFLA